MDVNGVSQCGVSSNGSSVSRWGEDGEIADGETHGVLLYYKFVVIPDVPAVVAWFSSLCSSLGLLGRIRIAPDGVNVTVSFRCFDFSTLCVDFWIRFHGLFVCFFLGGLGLGFTFRIVVSWFAVGFTLTCCSGRPDKHGKCRLEEQWNRCSSTWMRLMQTPCLQTSISNFLPANHARIRKLQLSAALQPYLFERLRYMAGPQLLPFHELWTCWSDVHNCFSAFQMFLLHFIF